MTRRRRGDAPCDEQGAGPGDIFCAPEVDGESAPSVEPVMLLASIAVSFACVAFFDECKACKPDDLCGVHQEGEQKALRELRGKLAARDVAQREKALADVAALTKAHENAPSRAVADTLAIALKDELFGVRAKAADLLVDGQHPDAAVKALTAALDDIREEFAKVGRGQQRGGSERSIVGGEGKVYVEAVVGGLAKLPDDRCVEALTNLLRQLPPNAPSEAVLPVAHALEQLGTRDGLTAIAQRMVTGEGTSGGVGGTRNGGGGGGGAGGGGKGGGAGGGGGGGGRGSTGGDGYANHGADEGQKKELHQTMTEAAASRKVASDAPKYDSQVAQAWKQWLEKHAAAFPAKLGHVGSTPLPKPETPAKK